MHLQFRSTFILTLATSKQRTKLRKAISVDHKKLQKLASQYNDLIDNYNLELAHTVVEEIACGHFPWSSLSSNFMYKIKTVTAILPLLSILRSSLHISAGKVQDLYFV